jgi:hypothetical protein
MPPIGGQGLKRGAQVEIFLMDTVVKRASPPTHGAIADTNMIELRVHLELNRATVA